MNKQFELDKHYFTILLGNGNNSDEATLYVTDKICLECWKMINTSID